MLTIFRVKSQFEICKTQWFKCTLWAETRKLCWCLVRPPTLWLPLSLDSTCWWSIGFNGRSLTASLSGDIMVSGYFKTDCSDPLPWNEEGLPSPLLSCCLLPSPPFLSPLSPHITFPSPHSSLSSPFCCVLKSLYFFWPLLFPFGFPSFFL